MKLAALAVLLAATTASADVPPIDEAITQAARSNKLLVLELGAVWCAPCVWFEQNVLPDPGVTAELAKIAFVRYDVDTPIGNEVARRYGVNGYPTFLVLDAQGGETFRATGFPGGKDAVTWFLELIRTGRATKSPLDELRAAVAAKPSDLSLRLKLAQALRTVGRDDEATAELTTVLTADAPDPISTAEAEAALEDMAASRRRIEAAFNDAKSFVVKHPASPLTSQRLALLVLGRGMDMIELERVLSAHLAAVRPIDRPDALRVALLARRPILARSAFAGWTDLDRTRAQLMRAELAIDDKKPEVARRLVAAACKDPGFERWCFDLQMALRLGTARVPGLDRLQRHATGILFDLGRPGLDVDHDSLHHLEPEMGNAVARALLAADRSCGRLAGKQARVSIWVDLAARGGTPKRVHIDPHGDGPLHQCLTRVIATTQFPAPTADRQRVQTMLVFDGVQERRPHLEVPPSARVEHGAAVSLVMRMGEISSIGVGVDAMFDLASVTQLRLTTSFGIEGGVASSENAMTEETDSLYAARVLVGVGYVPAPGVSFDLGVGLGKSKYGALVPAAWEIPAEARLRVARPTFTVHAWARATYLHAAPASRVPESTFALASSDEMALGLAISFPPGKFVFRFLGFVYEEREIGKSGTLVLGIPIGRYF